MTMYEIKIINGMPVRVKELHPEEGIVAFVLDSPDLDLYPSDALQEESKRLNDAMRYRLEASNI